MNNHMIVNLKNFTLTHDIIILDGNQHVVERYTTSMKNMSELVVDLCKRHNVSTISLMGNKNFSKKVGDNIQAINLAKYGLNFSIQYI